MAGTALLLRRRARLIASACASAAVLSVGTIGGSARAGELVDVRAVSVNGNPVADPKRVNVTAAGDVVRMDVFSQVRGVNGIKDERVWLTSGSFLSTGVGIKGDLAAHPIAPFDAPVPGLYQPANGTIVDLDTDGDLDVGWFSAVAVSGGVDTTTVLDANASEIKIGELTFVASNLSGGGGGGATSVNFLPRTVQGGTPFYSGAFWFEDGGTLALSQVKHAFNSSFAAGPPVVITVPEVATAAAAPAALATALGLVGRRRRP